MFVLDTLITTTDAAADYARPRWAAIKAIGEVGGPDTELSDTVMGWLADGLACGDLRQDESHYDTLDEAIQAGDEVKMALDLGLMPGHALLSMVVVDDNEGTVHRW